MLSWKSARQRRGGLGSLVDGDFFAWFELLFDQSASRQRYPQQPELCHRIEDDAEEEVFLDDASFVRQADSDIQKSAPFSPGRCGAMRCVAAVDDAGTRSRRSKPSKNKNQMKQLSLSSNRGRSPDMPRLVLHFWAFTRARVPDHGRARALHN